MVSVRQQDLARLAEEAHQLHRRATENLCSFLVRPSISILFFGDSDAYFRSGLRLITVGLNPSRREFAPDAPFSRFPAVDPATRLSSDVDVNHAALRALNAYFSEKPLRPWFGWYEGVLNGAGASYYGTKEKTALHTDIGSPLATDPTWGRLSTDEQAALAKAGTPLWHELVRVLAPDLILISMARQRRDWIQFKALSEWQTLYTGDDHKPYKVETRRMRVVPGKVTTVVFGQGGQVPFLLKCNHRRSIGQEIRRRIDAG